MKQYSEDCFLRFGRKGTFYFCITSKKEGPDPDWQHRYWDTNIAYPSALLQLCSERAAPAAGQAAPQ
jgi:hypothetical protein